MHIHLLDTGFFKLDGGAMFGVVPKTLWNKLNPADEHNRCNWAMRCLLVETGNRLVLVDTGIGDKQDQKFFSNYALHGEGSLQGALKKLGLSASDITDVFLTHLHFDHCGGAIVREREKLVPAFPRAVYWSNPQHWDWATKPNAREKASFLKENILPIQESGQLSFTGSAGSDVPLDFLPDFRIRFAFGHTDAMMLPQFQYKGRTVVYVADLFPSVAHLPLPYIMSYDMFPLTTLEEKNAFLEEALANNYVLLFEHDPVNECCELQRTEKGIRAARTFRFDEL